MSFLGKLGSGLGFIGSIVPGVGTGLAIGGSVLTQLDGAPDALTLNPFARDVFEPGHALWGVPQTDYELLGSDWMIDGRNQPLDLVRSEGSDARVLSAIEKEAKRRGSVDRVVGHNVWVPKTFSEPGYLVHVTGGRARENTGEVLRIPIYNALVATLQARVDAHGNADPVFPYIDLRGWDEYAADSWMDAGAPTMGTHGKTPEQLISMWRSGSISQAGWKQKRNQAYAQFVVDDTDQRAAYAVEAQAWRDFRAQVQQTAVQAQQTAQLEAAIQEYYANAPDKAEAAQAIANGEVHFALGQATADAGQVATGAFGLSQGGPSDDSTGTLIVLGAIAAGIALMIGAGK